MVVLQFSVLLLPLVTVPLPTETPGVPGAATTVKVLLLVAVLPAALLAVTVQVPVPVPVVPTDNEPLVPLLEPVAEPLQETEADVAPVEDQVNVLV